MKKTIVAALFLVLLIGLVSATTSTTVEYKDKSCQYVHEHGGWVNECEDKTRTINLPNTLKGDKGDKGSKGDKGNDGSDGKDGKDGEDGEDGLNGIDGKDGETGAKGDKGDITMLHRGGLSRRDMWKELTGDGENFWLYDTFMGYLKDIFVTKAELKEEISDLKEELRQEQTERYNLDLRLRKLE